MDWSLFWEGMWLEILLCCNGCETVLEFGNNENVAASVSYNALWAILVVF